MKEHKKKAQDSVAFYNNPDNRAIIYQVIAILVIAVFTYFILDNMFTNIENRGINTGFGFLNSEAGFGIIQSLISYTESDSYYRVFIIGILNTLLVSAISIFFATIIGFL